MEYSGIALIKAEPEISVLPCSTSISEISWPVFMNKISLAILYALCKIISKQRGTSVRSSHACTMKAFLYRPPDFYRIWLQSGNCISRRICFALQTSTIQIIGKITLRLINPYNHALGSKIISSYTVPLAIKFIQCPHIVTGWPFSVGSYPKDFSCIIHKPGNHLYILSLSVVNLSCDKFQPFQCFNQLRIYNPCFISIAWMLCNKMIGKRPCSHTFLGIVPVFCNIHGNNLLYRFRRAAACRINFLLSLHLQSVPRHNRSAYKIHCPCLCCIDLVGGIFLTCDLPCCCRNLGQHHCCCRCPQSYCQPVQPSSFFHSQ